MRERKKERDGGRETQRQTDSQRQRNKRCRKVIFKLSKQT